MEPDPLTPADKRWLLQLARNSVIAAVQRAAKPNLDEADLTPAVLRRAAAFVTLRCGDELRGCIGGLEAHWPLYEDVWRHAAQAAMQDPRFPAVTPEELPALSIEISVLTDPEPVAYDQPQALPGRLRPGTDGVTLGLGQRRATFLPQVWERVPEPERFLGMLCEKMGLAPDTWQHTLLEVSVYQVEEFSETDSPV